LGGVGVHAEDSRKVSAVSAHKEELPGGGTAGGVVMALEISYESYPEGN